MSERNLSNNSLARFTTFHIGGEAEKLTIVDSIESLGEALGEPSVILGRGSNVLISDKGVSSQVIIARNCDVKFNSYFERGEEVTEVIADAGVSLISLSRDFLLRSLSGLTFALGIPGSVGGGVIMNAGAFNGCMSDIVTGIDVIKNGNLFHIDRSDCGFAYRSSNIDGVVARVYFKTKKGEREELEAQQKKFKEFRKATQPQGFSAGSIFKGGEMPAGYYIDKAGLKGYTVGGAQVSSVHANFIINKHYATCEDVLKLIDIIRENVYNVFKVYLQMEVKVIGDF